MVFACFGAWLAIQWLVPFMQPSAKAATTHAWGWLIYGLIVGIAGMLGDLAESLIKRDLGRKDSSDWMPGFGGVLDVLDSIQGGPSTSAPPRSAPPPSPSEPGVRDETKEFVARILGDTRLVVVGGDHTAIEEVLGPDPRIVGEFLTVPDPKRAVLDQAIRDAGALRIAVVNAEG